MRIVGNDVYRKVPQVRILFSPLSVKAKFMFYVYILLSLKDKKFYVGMSADLKPRIAEHKRGHVKSTKHRLPIKLICYEAYLTKEEAEKRELYLKSSDGKKDLRKRLIM